MIAFSKLEPWGSLQEDFRAGQIAAAIWNVARDPARSEPLKAEDFMPALRREMQSREAANEPILLEDAKAQSDLIRARIFGVATKR
jgi:hypothetical protein